MNQQWLSPNNFQIFQDAIDGKGAPLENCWGFVDGIATPICRLGENKESCLQQPQEGLCYKIPICCCT